MSEQTQIEKLLREEQLIDLKKGKNDNAWISSLGIVNPDREEDDQ
jgi:hypothetical protein